MKRLWILLLTIVTPAVVSALPLGNPWDPGLYTQGVIWKNDCSCDWRDMWSVRAGYYGDFVFDRHMEIENHQSDVFRTRINSQAGIIALNLWNRADVFSTLGTTQLNLVYRLKGLPGSAGISNAVLPLNSDTRFSWSIGSRITLWEQGCWAIGGEGQYFEAEPHANYTTNGGAGLRYFSDAPMKYQEWQIGLGAAYRINITNAGTAWIPYVGVKTGQAKIKMNLLNTFAFHNLVNTRDWGYAVGCTLIGCSKISINAEARFIDTLALCVNSQFRF